MNADKHRWRRPLAALTVLIVGAAGGAWAPAARVEAHHIDAPSICGPEYVRRHRAPIRTFGSDGQYHRIGRLVVSKHRNSDTHCAVAVKRFHKRRRFMKVQIRREGDARIHTDRGRYRRYAGPVYRSLGGGSIDAWGYVGRLNGAYIICTRTCSTESGGG